MPDLKRGLGAFVAAFFVLTALAADSAAAESGANWKVKGANLTKTLVPSVGIKEIEKVAGTEEKYVGFLTLLGETKVEFRCTGMSAIGAKLETEGKISSGMKFRFSGCVFISKGVIVVACGPLNGGKEKGVIVTNALKGLLVLHEGKGLIRFEPVTGKSFATIEFGEECVFFPSWGLGGKLTLKDVALGTESASHLFVEGPLSELTLEGEDPMTFCGSLLLELTGEHTAIQWSGVPG
jgi:hypothetical protein